MDILPLIVIGLYIFLGVLSWLRWTQFTREQRIGLVLVLSGFSIQAVGIVYGYALIKILGATISVTGLITYFRLYRGLFGHYDDELRN